MKRPEPVDAARSIWLARYSSARVVFCAGSVVRGEAYSRSDLDLVVVFERLERAWRESFNFEGWPVEVFAHDPETLAYFALDDCRRGRPSLPQMVSEAVCVPGRTPLSDCIQSWAKNLLLDLPTRPSAEALTEDRYWITDLLDDLRDERPEAELRAIACKLYPLVCNFALKSRGQWLGSGKTLPRLMQRAAPEVASLLEEAFAEFFKTGERSSVIRAVRVVLAPFGGEVFEGFYSAAPAACRSPGQIPLISAESLKPR